MWSSDLRSDVRGFSAIGLVESHISMIYPHKGSNFYLSSRNFTVEGVRNVHVESV